MAGDTTITVIGNLTDDPELRFTPSGAASPARARRRGGCVVLTQLAGRPAVGLQARL